MARKKKLRIKKRTGYLIVFLLVLVMGTGFVWHLNTSKALPSSEEEPKDKVQEPAKPKRTETEASLVMVGDALIHGAVFHDAKQADGSYDFRPMFERIKPIVQNYDLAYYNQETILGGTELGLSHYPRFNSPYEVGDAFLDAGFNLVSLATNHTMDRGEVAVLNSRKYWDSKKSQAMTAGSYSSFEERDAVDIREKNGITYTLLSYTMWNNGLSTPAGKEYLNNEYDAEQVKKDIERVRDKVDVLMVAMHWGIEYSNGISGAQREVAQYLADLGVDIVIGSHPHVVEPIEFIDKTLVIYSLGNFISAQDTTNKLTGLMASATIKKVVDDGVTTISIENVKAELIYTYFTKSITNFKVYPYRELNDSLLPGYRNHYDRYMKIVVGDQGLVTPVGLD